MGFLSYFIQLGKFTLAKRKAKRLHKLDGRRYYVFYIDKKYYVLNKLMIKHLKKKKIFRKDYTIVELDRLAAFKTN